jgi:FixJ family two-component response regulator
VVVHLMSFSKPVVYIVDDEKVISVTLALILDQSGFVALPFQDPRHALAAAESGISPNLLISDVVMPGMTGVDLAIQFQRLYPQCKVLLFSGQAATAHLLEGARRQGYHFEFLAKPIHPADLIAKLRAGSAMRVESPAPLHEIAIAKTSVA